jgi:nucleotide-binding universal stress UspA family protein
VEEIYTPWQLTPVSLTHAEKRQETAQKRLEDLAKSETVFDDMKVRAHAILGQSVEALHKFQEREEIDLIMIATHGQSGSKEFTLGSFTGKVIELATCPVLVFREQPGPSGRAFLFRPARILVPYDFSGPSRVALETASEWAGQFGGAARLVYVVDDKAILGHILKPNEGIEERIQKTQREAKQELERLIPDNLQGRKADAIVRVGQPAAEILKEADAFGADLIIMASRGLSILERLSMGSVAERTIHGAKCPVLVIKQKRPVAGLLA